MAVELLCMGEPMLEFSQLPLEADGRQLFLEGHGGDTSNAAIAAARQGANVGMIAAVGNDMPGDSFIRLWQQEGVDCSTVLRSDRHLTGVYFITHDTTGHHFLHHRANSAAANYGVGDLPLEMIQSAKILYVSGISQGISESACDAVFAAIAAARASGVKVAYDTNYRPRLWPPGRAAAVMHAAMAHAEYAFPGVDDVTTLTGLTDPEAMLDFYLALGCRVVVLKMGSHGALTGTADGVRVRVPGYPVEAVDATGAGDTFCGSFLARMLAGDDPVEATRYACTAAALKCQGYGAVKPIPTAARVRAAMSQVNSRAGKGS